MTPTASRRILVIEDDATLNRLLVEQIGRLGHEATGAETRAAALKVLSLCFRYWDVRVFGDAVPDLLDEKNALGHAQLVDSKSPRGRGHRESSGSPRAVAGMIPNAPPKKRRR